LGGWCAVWRIRETGEVIINYTVGVRDDGWVRTKSAELGCRRTGKTKEDRKPPSFAQSGLFAPTICLKLLRRVGPEQVTQIDLRPSVDQTEARNGKGQIAVGVSDRRAHDLVGELTPGGGTQT